MPLKALPIKWLHGSFILLIGVSFYFGISPVHARNGIRVKAESPVDLSEFPPDVIIKVRVWDVNSGFCINHLPPTAFTVYEDDSKTPASIISVRQVNSKEMQGAIISFVVDVAPDEMETTRRILQELIDQLEFNGDPNGNEGEIWSTAEDHIPIEPCTSDGGRLRNRAELLHPATEMDRQVSLDDILTRIIASPRSLKQRAVVLIASCPASISLSNIDSLQKTYQVPPVYTVPPKIGQCSTALDELSRATGGVHTARPDEICMDINEKLRNQYIVRYKSGLYRDGQIHKIRVVVEGQETSADLQFDDGGFVLPQPNPWAIINILVISFLFTLGLYHWVCHLK